MLTLLPTAALTHSDATAPRSLSATAESERVQHICDDIDSTCDRIDAMCADIFSCLERVDASMDKWGHA